MTLESPTGNIFVYIGYYVTHPLFRELITHKLAFSLVGTTVTTTTTTTATTVTIIKKLQGREYHFVTYCNTALIT